MFRQLCTDKLQHIPNKLWPCFHGNNEKSVWNIGENFEWSEYNNLVF